MKQANSILLGMLMIASASCFMSCGNKSQAGGNADSIVADNDTMVVETQIDSLVNSNVDVSVSMSLPVGDGVAQKIRETLVSLMGMQIYKDADFRGEGNIKGGAFTGNSNDIKAMCTFYCHNIFKGVSKEFNEDAADALQYGDSSYIAPDHYVYSQYMDLVKVDENANYIVFDDRTLSFRGGSHAGGTLADNFIVFNRTTGEQVKNFLKPGSVKELQALLMEGFKTYFEACAADDPDGITVNNDQDVLDLLGLSDNDIIPLPKGSTIRPTAYGLEISYAQEEIGSYALGQPGFVIQYVDIQPFLTKEALELLK